MDNIDDENALRRAFLNGRRVGVWLATRGPRIQAENRRIQAENRNKDIGIMRGQDRDLSGVADMFGRAERDARPRVPRPRVARPEPEPALEGKYDEPEPAPEPPKSYRSSQFVRENSLEELKRRLRGKTAQELITFYRRERGSTRENLRAVATAVGANHRRPPKAKTITIEGVAQNIVEEVR